ncbi:autotransporter-associated beta strand repeat-containing protein [Bradyrhizobium sp. NFR13]|nr:autotransporter-associated beta strand repeat-containing protein [Bradyrhizobium sp. NFR13]
MTAAVQSLRFITKNMRHSHMRGIAHTVATLVLIAPQLAAAQSGGNGGFGSGAQSGGAGGGPFMAGSPGSGGTGGGGGGGGGAGQAGGISSSGSAGGAAGVDGHFSNGGNGGNGNGSAGPGQSGSGGGGGGSGLATAGGPVNVNSSFAGGAGGRGGLALEGGGGGGGAGGYGILATGAGAIVVDIGTSGAIGGGAGGNGSGPASLNAVTNIGGGFGGGGGAGVGFTAADSRLDLLSGTLAGGAGGIGGGWGGAMQGSTIAGGDGGAGGAGVLGSGQVINSAGTIVGGAGGRGGSSYDAPASSGGAGGDAIHGSGNTIFNSGTILGGNGGAGGSIYNTSTTGAAGLGGIGISGSDLSVINAGSISGGLADVGAGARANAILFSGGVNRLELQATNAGRTYSAITGNVVVDTGAGASGTLAFGGTNDASFDISEVGASGQYRGFASFEKLGAATWTLIGTTSNATPWSINGGTLSVASNGGLGAGAAGLSFDGGALRVTGTGFPVLARTITLGPGGGTIDVADSTHTLLQSGVISGTGALTKAGPGSLLLSAANSYSGGTTIADGSVTLAAADALGTGGLTMAGGTLNVGGFDLRLPYLQGSAGRISNNVASSATLGVGAGSFKGYLEDGVGRLSLVKETLGTLTLEGNSAYTGSTLVNEGKLVVNGSIASSSGVTVAAGARLGGSGALPTTVVNGGILAPGNSPGTLTVNGNLTLGAGSVYEAEIQGAVSDRINVTGTAALAGTLKIIPLGGTYVFNMPYTLLSAAGGRTGTFGPVNVTGTFGAGVAMAMGYTLTDVQLTLAPQQLAPTIGVLDPAGVAPANAYSVATAIDRAVAAGGDPSLLFAIYNLPAAAIPAAINQLSGEVHTAVPAMANVAADQFLRAMLDPMAAGRRGAGTGTGSAAFPGPVHKGTEKTGAASRLDASDYSVWGSVFGSHGRTDGAAATGSAQRVIDDTHVATGIDMRLTPGTIAGFAVAGGKARASLPGLVGKVNADVFQAGIYGTTQLGPVKLGAAAGYARLDNDVSRSIPALGSSLSSSYGTTAWSGRLQASAAAFNGSGFGLSPLAALQATHVRNPAVVEANWGGAGALALSRRSETASRSELGLQLDADGVFGGIPATGYVRAAWAHHFQREGDLTASLVVLSSAAFRATGAAADRNSALIAAGISTRLSECITLGLNLDGELSANAHRVGGSAQIRASF